MKITFCKPTECISFGAWFYWESPKYLRFCGIELDFKKGKEK